MSQFPKLLQLTNLENDEIFEKIEFLKNFTIWKINILGVQIISKKIKK